MRSKGGSAQDRRRARRAAQRRQVVAAATLEPRELAEGETIEEGALPALAEGGLIGERVDLPSPERLALEHARAAFAPDPACADCGHFSSIHEDGTGSCQFSDDEDGTCSCESFQAAEEAALMEATISQAMVRLTVGANARGALADALIRNAVIAPLGEKPQGASAGEMIEDVMRQFRIHIENFVLADDLPAELAPGETLPPANASPTLPDAVLPNRNELRWTGTIALEGTLTDDGRCFAPGSITWRDLPLTLMAQIETQEGHDGAQVAGRIDRIWREGYLLKASGVFDPGEFGQEIGRMVGDGTLRGVSIDTAIKMYDVAPRADYFDDDGNWAPKDEAAEGEEAEDLLEVLFSEEPAIFVVTDAVIGATTVCSFPAFADASIELASSLVADANPAIWVMRSQAGFTVIERDCGCDDALTASAAEPLEGIEVPADGTVVELPGLTAAAAGFAPVKPPAQWFEDPLLDELTPLTVTDDGQIFGHAAAWDTCHLGFPGACTTAPHSDTQYAYYLLKEIECDDGSRVPCGTITLEAPHADRRLGRADASAHYDNTGTAVADVVTGEDEFGIWVAGALRPDVDAEKARELRGAVLSGDWRDVNGNLELIALLAVNVPGFPVPRARALVASGEDGNHVLALVAAGIHAGTSEESRLNKIGALGDAALGRYADLLARAAG